mgnify:CR=1 FL=1
MEVATFLFAKKGFGSTSVREVVEAAGVTKPTLYYYFQNKESLFLELVDSLLDGLDDLIRESLGGDGSVRERLTRFVHDYCMGAVDNCDVVRLMWTCQHSPDNTKQPVVDIMSMHIRKMERLRDVFAQGIASGELRSDLDVDYAVLGFIGMVDLHAMALVHGKPVDEDFADRILDMFYRGVSG